MVRPKSVPPSGLIRFVASWIHYTARRDKQNGLVNFFNFFFFFRSDSAGTRDDGVWKVYRHPADGRA